MILSGNQIDKLIISYPIMILLYISIKRSLNYDKVKNLKYVSLIIFFIQLIFYTYKLCSDSEVNIESKNYNINYILNMISVLIGITLCIIFVYSFMNKKDKFALVGLCISIYIIFSHLFVIQLSQGIFLYSNIKLPIFHINSCMFIYFYTFHERKLHQELIKLQDDIGNKSIIDAGAYIGDTSIFLARRNPNQSIYAIEPNNFNYNYMNKLKELNNPSLDNLTTYKYLLSDKMGVNYNTTDGSIPAAVYSESNDNDSTIPSTTIDNLVEIGKIKSPIGLLHFDVEGMELEVVKGSEESILRNKPIIIVETLGKNKEKNKQLHDYILSLDYYKHLTVDESCGSGYCRNHIYKPEPK